MRLTKIFCCLITFVITLQVSGQQHLIGFYNLENLFDTVDDPATADEEFTPEGKNHWTDEMYQTKLGNMSRVIATINPDILGISEVENRKVIEDLVLHPNLAAQHYQIVHFDMNDGRGIDVALIYKPSVFQPFAFKRVPIHDPAEPGFITRDILWVKGLFMGDTLYFAVNHWPSRLGGKEDKRILAASTLRQCVDSIRTVNPLANMVMVGDFNDDPNNKSVRKYLMADDAQGKNPIINTAEPTFKKGYGTLAYNGVWNLFDQIFISSALADGRGLEYLQESFTIFAQRWMQEPSGKYKGMPQRTFRGGKFNPEGFSDHFPVFIVIKKVK